MSKNLFNRTVKTNIIKYPTDGTGRDCYITYNNAGFWKQNIKQITLKEKFSRKPFAVFHSLKRIPPSWNYHADGTGRDGYVLYDCGGLIHRFHSPESFLFRSNDNLYYNNNPNKNNFLTKDEILYKKKINKIQNDLLKRLYYKPKRENKFMYKESSAPNIFYKKRLAPIDEKFSYNDNLQNNDTLYNNERYNNNTPRRGYNTHSQIRNELFNSKNNEMNDFIPQNSFKPKNYRKYNVKCLSNSIDERVYNYPFNQFTYKK